MSSYSGREVDAKSFETMLRLLKVLKQKATKYTLQREKVKLDSNKIRHMFEAYENFDAADSVDSETTIESERINRSSAVAWILYYFNAFINNDVKTLSEKETNNIVTFYSQEERHYAKCTRVKIEQEDNKELDFNGKMKIYVGIASPLEVFMNLSKVLFKTFFSGISKSQNSFPIFFEINNCRIF
eukprot:TCONS_00056262-protein